MTHNQAGTFWNENAKAWIELSRAGCDVYRDWLNTPAFFDLLPRVDGLRGLDIGCGEGHNTRLLAERRARMTAIDIAPNFVRAAQEAETESPANIRYAVASAVALPFVADAFDFATAFMSLMDVPETAAALREAWRILKPGGFLQFSISHPCFSTPHRRNLRDETGKTRAIEVADYFRELDGDIEEWIFSTARQHGLMNHPKFRVPRFTRTLSQWLNMLIDTGFTIERLSEPTPTDDTVRQCPQLQDAQVVAYFLHIRARKPRS